MMLNVCSYSTHNKTGITGAMTHWIICATASYASSIWYLPFVLHYLKGIGCNSVYKITNSLGLQSVYRV